jgi:hypothetical protein
MLLQNFALKIELQPFAFAACSDDWQAVLSSCRGCRGACSMDDTEEPTVAGRIEEVRARLAAARGENLRAVQEDDRSARTSAPENAPDEAAVPSRKRPRNRNSEAERERNGGDAYTKSMRKRIARMRRQKDTNEPEQVLNHEASAADSPIVYGGAGRLKSGAAERVAAELDDVEKQKVLYRKQDGFDEDKADIGFINDPNRRFNKIIDKHYDKYESVRDIKESLERGTALP